MVGVGSWVEVPVDSAWWALDPTNQLPVGERHVKIGHGRDYEDVTPLRGVYTGGGHHRLSVSVDVTPIDQTQRGT